MHSGSHLGSIASPDFYDAHRHMHRGGVREDGRQHEDFEERIRHQHERSVLQSEIVNQKSKYIKKMTNLEKLLEQMKSEKRQLQQVVETQKQNFKL